MDCWVNLLESDQIGGIEPGADIAIEDLQGGGAPKRADQAVGGELLQGAPVEETCKGSGRDVMQGARRGAGQQGQRRCREQAAGGRSIETEEHRSIETEETGKKISMVRRVAAPEGT